MRYAPRDIYSHAEEYIAHCRRHASSSRLAALKIGLWGLKRAMFPRDSGLGNTSEFHDDCLHVAFVLEGGIGDILINANYMENFVRLASCRVKIDVYAGCDVDMLSALLSMKSFVSACFGDRPLQHAYDAVIIVLFIPKLLSVDKRRVSSLAGEKMQACLTGMRDFSDRFPEWTDTRSQNFAGLLWYAKLRKIHRTVLPSVGNMEEAFEENLLSFSEPEISAELIEKFPFLQTGFIAVNRSTGNNHESTKLWSVEAYRHFLMKIREEYPGIPLIRVGGSMEEELGCDMDLCGKTTSHDIMALLYKAELLISNEGGLVHLRHFLHAGKSIVLFGSTDRNFYGYPENENIGSDCSCEWLHRRWQEFCIKKYAKF